MQKEYLFREIVNADLVQVDLILMEHLKSDVPLAAQLAEYIIQSGGKRLRAILVLITVKLFNYSGNTHCVLASIIELIHTATLLHDDVVDDSQLRRGKPTANAAFGNSASVLVGDFLYSRAFQMMVDIQNLPILQVLAKVTNVMSEGEVMQLTNKRKVDLTEAIYLDTIQRKTAALFEAATEVSVHLCARSEIERVALAEYGRFLGTAFQLVDDALDYGASNVDIGKNLGDDLAEGKVTLPLIHAMKHGTEAQKKLIGSAIKKSTIDSLPDIIETFASTRAIEYTYERAEHYVKKAITTLDIFPESPIRTAMEELAQFAIKRSY